jgi:hypothetical protein
MVSGEGIIPLPGQIAFSAPPVVIIEVSCSKEYFAQLAICRKVAV